MNAEDKNINHNGKVFALGMLVGAIIVWITISI